MTTSPSRRGARVLAGLVVLATATALWGAGISGSVRGQEPEALSTQRVARALACVTGLPGGKAVVGSLDGEVRADRRTRGGVADISGGGPGFFLRAGQAAASTAYASQSARSGPWYAAQTCPEPSRQQWFVGAGGGRLHHTTLSLSNPRSGEAVVDVRVFGPKGELDVPGLRGLSVRQRPLALDLTKVAPSVDDLAVSVTAVRGLVSASAVDEWSAGAIDKRLTEFLPGQAESATDLLLGGLPERIVDGRLMVLNTGENAAVVQLRLVGKDGTFEPTKRASVTAPPGRLTEVPVPPAGRQGAAGIRLTSSEPIVAGVRARSGKDVVHASSMGALGDSAVIGLPAGAEGTLRLFNPDDSAPASARVRLFSSSGSRLGDQTVEVPPGASLRLAPKPLRSGAARVVAISGGGDLRAMLEVGDGGSAALPVASVSGETRVPAVVPAG